MTTSYMPKTTTTRAWRPIRSTARPSYDGPEEVGRVPVPIAESTNIAELVEWFEDAAAAQDRCRVVSLVSGASADRLESLQCLYSQVVRHPRFGRAWPAALPAGCLAPNFDGPIEST